MRPLLTIDNLSATAFSADEHWMSKLVAAVRFSDLNERPRPTERIDIASLTLSVSSPGRIFFSGSDRQQRTLIGLLEGRVRPRTGSLKLHQTVMSCGSVVEYLRRRPSRTVESAAASFLNGKGHYKFQAQKDLQDILATGGLLEYNYARLSELTEAEERALGVVLTMHTTTAAAIFSERDFELLGARGNQLGEEVSIRFSDRTVILVGGQRPPRWFRPTQTVVLV